MRSLHKRAQTEHVIVHALILLSVGLLLVYSYKIVVDYSERQDEAVLTGVSQEILETFDVIATRKGSVVEEQYRFPVGTEQVCFVDAQHKDIILQSPLIDRYVLFKQSLEVQGKENMFVIRNGRVANAEYVGNLCIDHYPYYYCASTRNQVLDILLKGEGTCTSLNENFVSIDDVESNVPYAQDTGSFFAHLHLDSHTLLTPENFTQVVIEPVFMNIQGVLSEVYNITPNNVILSKKAIITIYFGRELIEQGTNTNRLKVKAYYDGSWHNLETIDVNAVSGEISAYIDVFAPVAVFSSDAPTAIISEPYNMQMYNIDEEIRFNGQRSTDPNDNIVSYEWNFDDGTTSTEPDVTHSFAEPGHYSVVLKVVDEANNVDEKKITVVVKANNRKDLTLYNDQLFLISKEKPWQEILQGIPVTMWTDSDGTRYRYPYLVFDKGNGATRAAFIDPLQKNYNYSDIIVFGLVPAQLIGDADTMALDDNVYWDYWEFFENVVIVGKSNRNDALSAALFASFINAPIIFVDGITIGTYTDNIQGKKVYVIGNLDSAALSAITESAERVTTYTKEDITNPTLNPYIKLYSRISSSHFI